MTEKTQQHPPCPYCAGRTKIHSARQYRCTERGCKRTISRSKLALSGYSPEHDMTRMVPEGFTVRGVSTLYNARGEVAAQWVKSQQDGDALAKALEAAFQGYRDELPRAAPVPAPTQTAEELANVYVLTDFHLGMLSWADETGADWDMDIAEELLVRWFAAAIAAAPAATLGVFANIGDFLHWDGMDAVTPASKHILDADTRFQKLVRVAIRAQRRIIGMLLEKHDRVHVINAEGNHDPASSIWLREWLASVYENEPRVTIDVSADPYYCVEHGRTSLFFHHGHKRKMEQVSGVFVAKFREVFGRTKHSYAHTGHLHHDKRVEDNLMIVEQHRTLAAPDAYASRGGWMSGRDAKVITYHREHGEVGRLTISPEMVQ